MCPCLKALDEALKRCGVPATFRGQAWSENCREWVYYEAVLPLPEMRSAFLLPESISDHEHLGTHEGSEKGFVCTLHHDAVMGLHPGSAQGKKAAPIPRNLFLA